MPEPYNPLNKKNLGASVAQALLDQPLEPLPPEKPFIGAGVYVIYYTGDHKPYAPYEPIAFGNQDGKFQAPIYVGKAVPAGARKGGFGLDISPGRVLFNRLAEHAKSIEQAENLDLRDFYCRYITVDDIWIPLGESLLIETFSPIWNKVVDGFGNHDPGSGRHKQQNSPWDVIHPGRPWALNLQPYSRDQDHILGSIQNHLNRSGE